MTFMGKLLIVANLVLSFLFMAFAGAVFTVQQNWKQKAEDYSVDLSEAEKGHQKTLNELNDQNTRLDTENKNMASKLTEAQIVAKQWETKALVDEDKLSKEKTTADTSQAVSKLTETEAEFRLAEALQQRTVNKDLRIRLDQVIAKNHALENKSFDQDIKIKGITKRHGKILEQLAKARSDLRKKPGLAPSSDTEVAIEPPPPVTGKVVKAQRGKGNRIDYIEISIGSDDGLQKGHKLSVYREGDGKSRRPKYLGQIRLVLVKPDKAVGTVTSRAKNGVIAEGDNVTSRL